MSQSILIGSNKVTEAEVIQVPAVPFTRSHHPIHHRHIIDAIRSGVAATGLEIVNTEYVLANNGKRITSLIPTENILRTNRRCSLLRLPHRIYDFNQLPSD